jgi:hypothetical protein
VFLFFLGRNFFTSKIYLNQFFHKDVSVHDVEPFDEELVNDSFQTSSQTHGHAQISIVSKNNIFYEATSPSLMRTKSLSALFDPNTHTAQIKLNEHKPKPSYNEMSTQTETVNFLIKSGSSGEEYDDSSSLSINSQETNLKSADSNRKHNHLILRHQLTRDSGIDSDTNLQQKFLKNTPNENEERLTLKNEKKTTIEEISSFNLTYTKRHLNLLKSNLIKSSFSSTRDNSIDQESISSENLNDSGSNSNGDRDDMMVKVFSRNVIDDEENSLNRKETPFNPFSDDSFEKKLTNSNDSFDMASNRRQLFKSNSKHNLLG